MTKKSKKADLSIKTNEKLESIIENLQVNNIFLKSCNVDCITGPGVIESGEINITKEISHSGALSTDRKVFICFVTMKLKGLKADEPQFAIEACFALAYDILTPESVTDEKLELFAKTNAVYNAYPYFREFFQNTLVRMGLPPLQLPLLKPLTKKQLATGNNSTTF